MKREEIVKLFKVVSKEREEMLPEYLEMMKKYNPDKLVSPMERFKNDSFYSLVGEDWSEEKWQEEYNKKIKYSSDFVDDYRDPQNASFDMFFDYDLLWGDKSDTFEYKDFYHKFVGVMSAYGYLCNEKLWYRILDSDELTFENEDIVITDPCYVMNDKDWDRYCCGKGFDGAGFTKYSTRDTMYGDWSCSTINTDTGEEIGTFAADAGLVGIFKLDEIRKKNEEKAQWCEDHWCATVIKDFTGTAQIKVGYNEEGHEFYVYVEGKGSVNFKGLQTGF